MSEARDALRRGLHTFVLSGPLRNPVNSQIHAIRPATGIAHSRHRARNVISLLLIGSLVLYSLQINWIPLFQLTNKSHAVITDSNRISSLIEQNPHAKGGIPTTQTAFVMV